MFYCSSMIRRSPSSRSNRGGYLNSGSGSGSISGSPSSSSTNAPGSGSKSLNGLQSNPTYSPVRALDWDHTEPLPKD